MEGGKRTSSKGKTSKKQAAVEYEEEEEAINTSSKSNQEFVDKMKKRATVKTHGIDNHATFEHPASFQALTGRPDKASIRDFIEQCDIEVLELNEEEIVFDLIGAEPPLANALRRILIAEIPTIAIEKVNMWQNTSVIPDENLAHRVGLIPIKADPRNFENHKRLDQSDLTEPIDPTTRYGENDCIKFKLHVRCTKKDPDAPMIVNNTVDEEKFYNHPNVYASDLEWIPLGDQAQRFKGDDIPKPLYGDILIAKLRPGQEIEMELFCEKGIGKTHAKWSPVCTAYYRLVPDIKFNKEILNEDAKELKKLCPTGVFDIEDLAGGKKRAIVGDVRKCTTCRECIRHDKFREAVDLGKIKDRFEFHVESIGVYNPAELVVEALKKLKEKAQHWLEVIEQQENGTEAEK